MDLEETKRRLTREIRPQGGRKLSRRSVSEGGRPRDPSTDHSRQSSSGSSREVRCACQYFQCDSLLPDRVNRVGTRPSSRLAQPLGDVVAALRDHEYEPISPPSEASAPEAPPPVHVIQLTDLNEKTRVQTPPESAVKDQQFESKLLRIPLDTELIIPSAETPEPEPSTQTTPTATLSSRTEGISSSQVDTSKIEELPLKKESRPKKMEQSEPQGPNIQEKLKTQAGRLKTKIQSIKRPTFTIPNPKFSPKFKRPKFQRPKFQKPKFEAPKFSMPAMPKIPDRPKINFPTFKIPRPGSTKRPHERPISTTESSGSPLEAQKKNIFDFRTYPRIFDRTKRKSGEEEAKPAPEFATIPRAAAQKKGPVGSRWVHRFTDIQFADEESNKPSTYTDELSSKDRGDSLERRMEADLRYEQALAEADDEMRDYERENQDIHRHSPYIAESMEYPDRWRHGSFHRRENLGNSLQNGVDSEEVNSDQRKHLDYVQDERSSLASSGHRGVIEEIDSDQFFLREKGISQDNIQVGLYLSSEIRDAFRQPVNALSQMERDYELDASDISLTRPSRPKRKHLKKTKRLKKTPHASHENIPFDQESVNTEPDEHHRDFHTFPLPKPRRNKRSKILAKEESLEISQSELGLDEDISINIENLKSQEDLSAVDNDSSPNIIGYIDKDLDVSEEYNKYLNEESMMYENEVMQNIEQPEITINGKYEIEVKDIDKYLERTGLVETPKPPKRRHKSLKSLSLSEQDSIMGEFNRDKMVQDILDQELTVYHIEHDYIIPTEEEASVTPVAPKRTRSRSRGESQADDDRTSHGADSLITESEEFLEPPPQKELRDAMGYAIIDKSHKHRDTPSTPRRRRSAKSDKSPSDTKFFTVPRALNDTPPTRPIRNYSTVAPNRPPRKKSEQDLTTAEEKENIDISQYIEIEDEDHGRDLQSGEIINRMKGRPLPAPPRPPRKSRDRSKEAFRDITQQSNIISDTISENKTLDISPASPIEAVEEIEVSTQTDPLPDDFCCEEFIEEPTDIIVAPTRRKRSIHRESSIQSIERPKTPLERDSSIPITYERPKTPLERASSPNAMVIARQVHTPVEDETITHASLIVQPVPEYSPDSFVSKRFGADIPDMLPSLLQEEEIQKEPVSALLQEHPLEVESVPEEQISEEVPEIPEKPQRRKSQAQIPSAEKPEAQPQIIERIIERQVPVCVTPGPDTEVEVLKAQRLQVAELDVDKLNVSELQANKILVSEIDGMSLQISELSSKSGSLIVNGLEIPSGLIQEILDRIQPTQPSQPSTSTEQVATQTSIEEPDPNTKEFAESEQVATQTSIEIPTEQVSTQTSIEESEPEITNLITEQVATQTVEEFDTKQFSTEQVATQTSIDEVEETKELDSIFMMHADQAVQLNETEVPSVRFPSPTIVVDPPEPSPKEPEAEKEKDALDDIKERIRFIEEEMNQFISDFTPDELNEIKSEIDSIIEYASEHVRSSRENIPEDTAKDVETPSYDSVVQEELIVFTDEPDNQEIPDLFEESESVIIKRKASVAKIPDYSVVPKEFHELRLEQEEIFRSIQEENEKDATETQEQEDKIIATPPPRPPPPNQEHIAKYIQPPEETTPILMNLPPPRPPPPDQEHISKYIQPEIEQTIKTESSPQTPPRSSSPIQEHITEHSPPTQIYHEIHYPFPYYQEYSMPPSSFYTLRPHPHEISEEEAPVHHRRRRHHRHLSRSSSEEDRRAVSRRHATRSPEPSIPQLSGQLARACSNSATRVIRRITSQLGSHFGTREGKQDLKIALVILLVLIAGLILLGFGSGKTVHLHHWEYFNPPKEL